MIADPGTLTDEMLGDAAVVIVGAGAAGISLACELDGQEFKVLLLEAGGLAPDDALAEYYLGDATPPHPPLNEYRRSAFGGTTSLWGGRCIPLDPIDFERREYISHSGWPIGYQDLARYYPAAMRYCDAGAADFTVKGSLSGRAPVIAGFDGQGIILTDQIERYSLPTDFGKRYRQRISQSRNVTALLHARCTGLNRTAGNDSIESLQITDRTGRRHNIRAKTFVLAMGGIEVPRLLLNSERNSSGLGNSSGLVGRFYSCHFEAICGRLIANGAPVSFGFERTTDGVYCRRQLRFSETTQREQQLLNSAFRLHFPEYSDASHASSVMSAIYLAKSILPTEYRAILQHGRESGSTTQRAPHVANILRGLPDLVRFSFDWVFRIQLATRKLPYTLVPNADGSYPLEFNCEQTPSLSNRIDLSTDEDRHGLKRARATWQVSREDVETAFRGFKLLRDTLNRNSVSRLEFDEELLHATISRAHPLGGHHIGTTRMGSSEHSGVVGPDCNLYDANNVYVASSAVFPTSGYANPTLTIIALAIRIAEKLRREHTQTGQVTAI